MPKALQTIKGSVTDQDLLDMLQGICNTKKYAYFLKSSENTCISYSDMLAFL